MNFIHDIERDMLINLNQIVKIIAVTGGVKGEDVKYIQLELSNNKKYKLPMSIETFKKTLTASNISKFINIEIEDVTI